jgi:hypothetical protein
MRTGVAYAHSFSLCEQSRHGIGNERDQLDLELPPRMSAVGPKETFETENSMSPFRGGADAGQGRSGFLLLTPSGHSNYSAAIRSCALLRDAILRRTMSM